MQFSTNQFNVTSYELPMMPMIHKKFLIEKLPNLWILLWMRVLMASQRLASGLMQISSFASLRTSVKKGEGIDLIIQQRNCIYWRLGALMFVCVYHVCLLYPMCLTFTYRSRSKASVCLVSVMSKENFSQCKQNQVRTARFILHS